MCVCVATGAVHPLTLLAAGMRRKTIVFVNVDVYKVEHISVFMYSCIHVEVVRFPFEPGGSVYQLCPGRAG